MSPNKNKQERNKNKFANSGLVRQICIFHSQLPNLTELVLNRSAQTWKTALGCIQYLHAYIYLQLRQEFGAASLCWLAGGVTCLPSAHKPPPKAP